MPKDEETGNLTSSITNLRTTMSNKFQQTASQMGLNLGSIKNDNTEEVTNLQEDDSSSALEELSDLCPKLTFQQILLHLHLSVDL